MFGKLPVDIGHLVVSGTKITMEQPRLSGFTDDARAYEFTAAAAAQDMTKPDIIELHNIRAKMQMQDKSTMQMTAVSGVYDSKGETLKLNHDIRAQLEQRLPRQAERGDRRCAQGKCRRPNIRSRSKMLQGTLDANRLRDRRSGDSIRFERRRAHGHDAECTPPNPRSNKRPRMKAGHGGRDRVGSPYAGGRRASARRARGRCAAASKGPPNALQGFSQNRDQPVHIEAATLEVRDKDKVATFSGNVHVKQGDTDLLCKSLVVFYEQDGGADGKQSKGAMQAATPGPGGQQQIKRLEARGGVVVTQKDQTATGELGIFDMATNTVTLTGNVVMTQGQNVLRGEKLVVEPDQRRVARGIGKKRAGPRAGPVPCPGSAGARWQPAAGDGARASAGAAVPLMRNAAIAGAAAIGISKVRRRAGSTMRREVPGEYPLAVSTQARAGAASTAAARREQHPAAQVHVRRAAIAGARQAPRARAATRRPAGVKRTRYLAAHGVEKSFGGRKVVKGVTLYVRRGEAVGLLGPNGAGKTTVFYMITGLIKADRGRIELDGHDVTALPMYQRARLGIGYLPQEASIFRGLNVEDNIRAVLEVVEPDRRRREADLNALLEEFNIARLRKTPTHRAVGRRAPPRRDRPRAGDAAELHAARRAVRRHRPDRRRRHPGAGAAPDQSRHRRADHRPQCARDPGPDRPRLHHLFRRGADGGPRRGHRQQSRRAPALSRRGIPALDAP